MRVADFSFDALRRHPDVEAPNLHAVDASDRLILDEAAPAVGLAPAGTVSVIGDRYGALTLGLVALHGAQDVRTHQDARSGELALMANADRLGLGGFTLHPLDASLVAGARVVLLQLPRSLEELDEIAGIVATHAHPEVLLVAGGRLKHMTRAMNDVIGRSFEHVEARLARQKSRVLVATGPRPEPSAGPVPRWPAVQHHTDLDLTVCAHGGAFAGTRVDLGTRLLLGLAEQMAPSATRAVDLGCGTGVVAVALARARPDLQVVATDDSAAAIASTLATARANGLAERVTVLRDDAAAGLEPASVDLVVLNPPFHVGAAVHTGVALKLFTAAARVLRPGGELWTVWNSHLTYRPALERAVGPTRQAARTPTFTVTVSTRA